jgi:endonuclease YncB( thermonuclease family)
MKKLLAVLLLVPALAFAQKTPKGVVYDAQILRVSDGDTIVIAAPFLPQPLKPELAVRIYGVDTPEKGFRGQCDQKSNEEKRHQFSPKISFKPVSNDKWSFMDGISSVGVSWAISF